MDHKQQSDQPNNDGCMQIANSAFGYGHGASVAFASDHSKQTFKQQAKRQPNFQHEPGSHSQSIASTISGYTPSGQLT